MDLATLIGLIGAFGIVMTSIILGGSAGTFVNTPSLLVVLGGTITTGCIMKKRRTKPVVRMHQMVGV